MMKPERDTLGKMILKHIALPLLAPAVIVGLYFTPVDVFGCTVRGMIAVLFAVLSAVGSLGAAWMAVRAKRQSQGSSDWWLVTALILLSPLVLLIWPLG